MPILIQYGHVIIPLRHNPKFLCSVYVEEPFKLCIIMYISNGSRNIYDGFLYIVFLLQG